MKVCVTGAAGYIGSVVTELLCDRGMTVIALDNLRNGHREAVDPRALFYPLDLLDVTALQTIMNTHLPDAVVHLAAEALIGESMSNPGFFYRENVVAGLSLLDAMVQAGVHRLVFSSSSSVYGIPEEIPIIEEAAGHPCNPYGETKWVLERALYWYYGAHGIKSISLRYFNACGATRLYGEDHRPETHIIPLLFDVALGRRDAFNLYGTDYPTSDGTCIRDYIHVADIALAHLAALEKMDQIGYGAFNIGNGFGYSNRDVVDMVRRVTESEIIVRESPRRPGDPPVLVADARRIGKSLDWHSSRFPRLEEMVSTAWEWRKAHPEGYRT